jgi:D-arabinose 1-dehydrogenase-like Zn-dependent alcohol dehydrogenase
VKALFKAAPQPGALEIREVPRPEPRADEVVIDVAGASICGSDLHIVHWHPMAQWTSTPVILGHEFGGIVREVGSDVTGFKVGDAVAAECLRNTPRLPSPPRSRCTPSCCSRRRRATQCW